MITFGVLLMLGTNMVVGCLLLFVSRTLQKYKITSFSDGGEIFLGCVIIIAIIAPFFAVKVRKRKEKKRS